MAHKSQTERDTWDLSYYTGVRAQVVMEQLFETSNRSKEGCFFAMVLLTIRLLPRSIFPTTVSTI